LDSQSSLVPDAVLRRPSRRHELASQGAYQPSQTTSPLYWTHRHTDIQTDRQAGVVVVVDDLLPGSKIVPAFMRNWYVIVQKSAAKFHPYLTGLRAAK